MTGSGRIWSPRSPYVLLGSAEAMIDALVERRERWGLSYIVCFEKEPGGPAAGRTEARLIASGSMHLFEG